MKIVLLGASGATGRHVADMLLSRGHEVTIVVRSPEKLPEFLKNREKLTTIGGSVSDLSDAEIESYVQGCDVVASCLGHNISFKGMYGHPRRLVAEAERRFCEAIRKTSSVGNRVKFVLMSSSGVVNKDEDERISAAQRFVVGLIRLLVPPHKDNESAADYLRTQIGPNDSMIEWSAVRPDGLIDEDTVSEYEAFVSPTRSAIFNAGKISRINVAHFMTELISDDDLWQKWKGRMPVLYGASSNSSASLES